MKDSSKLGKFMDLPVATRNRVINEARKQRKLWKFILGKVSYTIAADGKITFSEAK